MIGAIKYNLANLTNLEGRDARQTFWFYVLFLVITQFVVGIIAAIPMYVSMATNIYDAVSQGANEQAAMQAMVGDMVGQIKVQMIVSMVISVIVALMLVASFVRRLHDGSFPGWIVTVPLATQAVSMYYTISSMDRIEELMMSSLADAATTGASDPMALQAEMGGFGMIGWIGYIVVIIFGAWKSVEGPNKYGEAPVRF